MTFRRSVGVGISGLLLGALGACSSTGSTAQASITPVDEMTWLQQAGIDQSMAERIAATAELYHDTIYTPPFSEDELWTTASGVLQNC